jgi:8-oxo-dGTP pyrophosphatase MutT (NUDIX family)
MRSEKLFFVGVKGLARNDAGEVLLLKADVTKLRGNKEAYWDLPGGRIEHGLTELETLQKEIQEETGIRELGRAAYLQTVISNHDIPLHEGGTAGLVLRIWEVSLGISPQITLSEEHVEYQWVEPDEASHRLSNKYPAEFCDVIKRLDK